MIFDEEEKLEAEQNALDDSALDDVAGGLSGLIPPIPKYENSPDEFAAGIPDSTIGNDHLSKGLGGGLKKDNYRPDDAKFVPTSK